MVVGPPLVGVGQRAVHQLQVEQAAQPAAEGGVEARIGAAQPDQISRDDVGRQATAHRQVDGPRLGAHHGVQGGNDVIAIGDRAGAGIDQRLGQHVHMVFESPSARLGGARMARA